MENEDDTWSARPTREVLRDLHADGESVRWIAVIEGIRIAVGDPVDGYDKCLYLPQWLMDSVGLESTEEYNVEFNRSEDYPKATRIGLKIIGDIPDDMDIKELLEEPLSQLGVLEEGQIIPAPVLEGVSLLVQICEPAGAVFLDGEASLEIETDGVIPSVPDRPPSPCPEDDFSMTLPAAPIPWQPFQGVGRRLCDKFLYMNNFSANSIWNKRIYINIYE